MNPLTKLRAAFLRLPVRARLVLALSFLLLTTLSLVGWISIRTLALLFGALVLTGVIRVSKVRLFLLMVLAVPLVVGLVLSGFDWSHPFFSHYLRGVLYVFAVGFLVDGLRFEEWIELLRGDTKPRWQRFRESALHSLLAIAVGRVSLPQAINRERGARKMAAVAAWFRRPVGSRLLDYLALPIRTLLETLDQLDLAVQTWSNNGLPETRGNSVGIYDSSTVGVELPSFANSSHPCGLSDVYYFPEFTKAVSYIFSQERLSPTWIEKLICMPNGTTILEIGAGTGRLTSHLLRHDVSVDAAEPQGEFLRQLCRLRADFPNFRPMRGYFPDMKLERYRYVLMHQNVFLELINQSTLQKTLDSLKKVLAPSGIVLMDYPASFSPPDNGVLFQGSVPQLGELLYKYEHRGSQNYRHSGILTYDLTQRPHRYLVRARLVFNLPPTSEVQSAAEEAGFETTIVPLQGAFSFFASSMNLVQLRRK